MSAVGYATAVGQAALDALSARLSSAESAIGNKADASAIPQPATSAPPMIGDVNSKGTGTKYALEGHTHMSNVQAKRIQIVGSSGQATWTFATPFDVAPVIDATAETPAGATYINVATVLEGSVSVTSATIVVQQVVKTVTLPTLATALLGLVLTLFGFAPAGVYVNCFARRPS